MVMGMCMEKSETGTGPRKRCSQREECAAKEELEKRGGGGCLFSPSGQGQTVLEQLTLGESRILSSQA